MDQQNQNLFDLQLDQQSFSYFHEAAKWAKFIAIIGFVFCFFMVIIALFAGTIFASMGAAFGTNSMLTGGMFTIIYLIFAALWFFPCMYLFRFASQMQWALQHNEQIKLQNAIRNLKSYFRYVGIFLIVMLSIYALAIIGAIVAGVSQLT
jgi:hypothetical protein